MPAETHQFIEDLDVDKVLELLVILVGVDAEPTDDPGGIDLGPLGLDDDGTALHLWEAVEEEYGERSVGELDLDDEPPATLGELAELFHLALRGDPEPGSHHDSPGHDSTVQDSTVHDGGAEPRQQR